MSGPRGARTRMAAITAGLAIGVMLAPAPAPAETGTRTIVIEAMTFAPPVLVVRRGERIVWENRDPFPHTATAAGAFDSGSIGEGGQWVLVPRVAGTYDYVCTLHPTMRGRLVVQ